MHQCRPATDEAFPGAAIDILALNTSTSDMTKAPQFSIITTCKGRLDHLKQTLPAMLAQADAEVIVVDFSCPQDTAGYVERNLPGGSRREGGWQGLLLELGGPQRRCGRGARRVAGVLRCDIVLDEKCTSQLGATLVPGDFGKFKRGSELVRHRPTARQWSRRQQPAGFPGLAAQRVRAHARLRHAAARIWCGRRYGALPARHLAGAADRLSR